MKMDIVAGSGNDEFYTPEYAIRPIMKYVPAGSRVLCPFDTQDSNFVKMLSKDNKVVSRHINNGTDFFTSSLDGFDYVISNPPYSLKRQVFEMLFSRNVKFAMLVGVVGLFESKARFDMFKNNDFEIMYINKRISYFKDFAEQKPSLNPPFSSVYVCKGMLPKQIIFEEVYK